MTAKKTPKKPKPLTKVQQLERQVSILESAVYQAYNDYEEIFALIRVFRIYVGYICRREGFVLRGLC